MMISARSCTCSPILRRDLDHLVSFAAMLRSKPAPQVRQDGWKACSMGRSILGPWYALPVRFGISVVFVGPAVAPVAGQGR